MTGLGNHRCLAAVILNHRAQKLPILNGTGLALVVKGHGQGVVHHVGQSPCEGIQPIAVVQHALFRAVAGGLDIGSPPVNHLQRGLKGTAGELHVLSSGVPGEGDGTVGILQHLELFALIAPQDLMITHSHGDAAVIFLGDVDVAVLCQLIQQQVAGVQ